MSGDPFGQYRLGLLYADGKGVPKDFVKAYALYNFSPMHDKLSADTRGKLASKMSRAQIEAGQALIREMQRIGVLEAL